MNQLFYIGLAIITNFIWGLAFFAPYLLDSISPAAIAFGRYLCYGLMALVLGIFQMKSLRLLTRQDWGIAFWFALCGNVGYYLLLTAAIHYSGVSVTALIVGTVPITMMVLGNLIERQISFKQLLLPLMFILLGLLLINGYKFSLYSAEQDAKLLWGIVFSVGALIVWTWYGVHNIYYLKAHHHIRSQQWTIAIGLSALVQSVFASTIYFGVLKKPFFIEGTLEFSFNELIVLFVITCLVLGIVVSWFATLMWNVVSRHLPAMLVGQAIVFEIIASIAYEHLWDWKFPSIIELGSILLIISGVLLGVYVVNKEQIKQRWANQYQQS
ncbi:MAG: EamA family transporter [Legionellales bacterium]|nr:EamA family transporter [Legionellales bacterium]